MKKTVIIILAILPIFLVITISFAGKILSLYQHIAVEKVRFVDESNKEFEPDYILVLSVGEEKQTNVRVYPDLASNKKVTYISDNESVCTVNQEGVVKGVSFGTSAIIVKTEEGSKTTMLVVKVTQDKVLGVTLSHETLDLKIGESKVLTATVEAYVALNKKVIFTSNDETVATVNANGKVEAVGIGQAIITVTTEDGGFTDTCVVTCIEGIPALQFDLSNDSNFVKSGKGYIVYIKEIDLLNYLKFDDKKVDIQEIKFRIKSGGSSASLTGDKLTITGKGIITVVAYVGEQNDPTYQTELRMMIQD
ncbi:MAG: Ig domain-containing protein [Clostridia bacterium]|nr:Ig domain-containing protein [Clostridia bacterium]